MKKILSITLSVIMILGALPLNAQEIPAPVISREDMDHYNDVSATINKEFNQSIVLDNPHAVHEEFKQILKYKSDQAFKNLKKNPGKTYSDKQTAWNMAFFPLIDKEEKYPKSKYFQEPYLLYSYALEVYWQNLPEGQHIGMKDYRTRARKHIREIIGKRSQNKNFFADTTIEETRNPMTEVPYLIAYATQINSFYNEVQELKYRKQTCKNPKMYGIEDVNNDVDCQRALALADNYDLKTIQSGAIRIGTFASIAADEVDQCLRNVLMPLQTPLLPFEEVDEFLNSMGGSEAAWASCGMSKKELVQIITDNSMTREEAKKSLKKGLGGKILQGLDYISFSYWADKADKVETFENYVIDNFGEEKLEELKKEGNEKQEREIAERMAESYNAVLSAIATDLISYGKIFYYHNDVNLVGLNEDNVPINASSKFAKTWYKMGTDQTQEYSPIAKFARGAILQAGGKAKTFQDGLFTKTMYEVKAQENVKTNIMVLSMAMDFVDPFMALAPLQEIKAIEWLKMGAKYAPKTTRAVYNTAKTTGGALTKAKTTVKNTKVVNTITDTTQKLKQPFAKTAKKIDKKMYGIVEDDWNFGKHLDDPGQTVRVSKGGNQTNDVAKGLEKGTSAADDVADVTTPAAKTTPKPEPTTATDPEKELGPKLTGEFDETLAKAGKTEPEATTPSTRKCIGFNCKDETYTPTNTTTGAPEGMRRRIGFSQEPEYIPDEAGKAAANGKGGVQDFTKGNNSLPGSRTPEGPSAKNPYDVRNSAGGADPSGPQQDLSGLNQNIATTPEPTPALTRERAEEIYKERKNRKKSWWYQDDADRDLIFHGTGEVRVDDPKKGTITITSLNGNVRSTRTDKDITLDNFLKWVDNAEISDEERKAIKGLDEILASREKTKQMDKLFSYNGQLPELIAYRPHGISKSLNNGCSSFESCKRLLNYLIDSRKDVHDETSRLLSLYTQTTGNNDVEAMYKSLLDFFERTDHRVGSNYLNDFLNDQGLRNFLFNNGTVPDFSKIADNMLSKANTDDLAKILKSEVPDNFKSLQQVASADDWKGFVSSVRGKLEKRLSDATNLYNSSLDKAAEKAPELIADIRSGKKKIHRITLRRAVGKQTADDIVDSYREIEKLNTALGNNPVAVAKAKNTSNVLKKEEDLLQNVTKVEKKAPTVYKVSDGAGFEGYVKVTTPNEVERTKMVQTIMDGNQAGTAGLRKAHTNIEIDCPRVISEDTSSLPSKVQDNLNAQIQQAAKSNGSRTKILNDPNSTKFIMSSVDTGGMNYVDLKMAKMDTSFPELQGIIMKNLNNQPITKAEWDDIASLVREMNQKGFHHGDLGPNMFLKRNPSTGKLKVTFIDFELPPGGKYAKDEDIVKSFQSLLSQYGALAF